MALNSEQSNTAKSHHLDDDHQHRSNQLIVNFPASRHRCQEEKQVRFASVAEVKLVHSVRHMCSKQELWYSSGDVMSMRFEMKRDAYVLAQTLRSPSDKVLRGGIDISQAVGLDKLVDPFLGRKIQETTILQRRTVVRLQEQVLDEDELRRVSERFSRESSVRAHTLAKGWVALDGGKEKQ